MAGNAPMARPKGTATTQAKAKSCSANRVKMVWNTCSGGGTNSAFNHTRRLAIIQTPKNSAQMAIPDHTACRCETGARTRSIAGFFPNLALKTSR